MKNKHRMVQLRLPFVARGLGVARPKCKVAGRAALSRASFRPHIQRELKQPQQRTATVAKTTIVTHVLKINSVWKFASRHDIHVRAAFPLAYDSRSKWRDFSTDSGLTNPSISHVWSCRRRELEACSTHNNCSSLEAEKLPSTGYS